MNNDNDNDLLHVADWKWNVWKVDPKTGKRLKWLGMISTPKDGFEWLKKQGQKSVNFRINNVPPSISRTRTSDYEVYAPTATTRARGEDLPKDEIPGKTDFVPRKKQVQEEVSHKPWTTAAPKAPKVKDTKEMQKVKADAKVILEKHKSDEAADVAAGNIKNV